MDNRISELFNNKNSDILNIYFTAGFPELGDTANIIRTLDDAGADLIELGMPYSDPLADGTTIQESSKIALENGMSLEILWEQIREARQDSGIPIILMGYYNQLLQYGTEKFISTAAEAGVDGLIIPDLPPKEYEKKLQAYCQKENMGFSFLVSPSTSVERIRLADRLSSAFLYMISTQTVTGGNSEIRKEQIKYFKRIEAMNLKNPRLIGFGIHDRITYNTACHYSHGAIIGSAFIRKLREKGNLENKIHEFIKSIRS